jgi:hypothetical protein
VLIIRNSLRSFPKVPRIPAAIVPQMNNQGTLFAIRSLRRWKSFHSAGGNSRYWRGPLAGPTQENVVAKMRLLSRSAE